MPRTPRPLSDYFSPQYELEPPSYRIQSVPRDQMDQAIQQAFSRIEVAVPAPIIPRNRCYRCGTNYEQNHHCFTDTDLYVTFRDCHCVGCAGGLAEHVQYSEWRKENGTWVPTPRPAHTGLLLTRSLVNNMIVTIGWVCEYCKEIEPRHCIPGRTIPQSMSINRVRLTPQPANDFSISDEHPETVDYDDDWSIEEDEEDYF